MIIRRRYLDKIRPFIDKPLVKVLIGVRRSGKTVLLEQIKELILAQGVGEENFIQINFESMKYCNLLEAENLYDYVSSIAEKVSGRLYIMLDEIQNVANWQKAVASFKVDFDCDIYITGSNSKLLSGELATYLSGRYIQIKVYPFTLAEVKAFRIEQGTYTTDEALFADYLKYGGFPQRCLFKMHILLKHI